MENHGKIDDTEVKPGSERSFGIVFAVVFAVIGGWPLLDGSEPRYWALIAAAVFLLVAFVYPRILSPLNRLWFRFGMLLHHVVTPVVLGVVFFVTVVPIGLLMRALGKDPLRLRRAPEGATYWIARDASRSGTMSNQF